MSIVRKCVALLLLLALALQAPLTVWAEQTGKPDVTVLGNAFIKVTVDNHTGRFAIRTVDGQPVRKNDQQVDMMFRGDDPETSFTTFRIDGTDYIFGNPYKFAPSFFSEITQPVIVNNPDGTRQIETVWTIKGIQIKQILMLYTDVKDKKNAGNVNVRYEVNNRTGADVQVGSRILLDTMVGGNDGPGFQVGTAYKVPLQVERRLVDPSKLDPGLSDEEKPLYTLPAYWVMKDKYDPTNPLATNVMAYGFNNFSEKDINIVDEMVVGHWNRMANAKWDYQVNPNLDFTTDTNDYGTADSAVALYWNPKAMAKGASKSFETVYGLGEIIQPDKVFSIRYIDPVNQLATLPDGSAYENEGVFDIIAEIENLPSFGMEHSEINVEMQLSSGLAFADLDERGQLKRENGKIVTKRTNQLLLPFRKDATPEEAKNGIIPKYKPGDTVTASFKVVAQGKAWPTTREYLLTARSPETESKLEQIKGDETVKAQYMSSKSNFVFLPAIGQAAQTYVYAMSPKEVYATDVKYMTLNLSNIEAYNTGNATSDPNFDLFLKETASGKRYKVPVKESVLLQPSENGQSGDMRITYRTGDLIDASGNVVKDDQGKPQSDLGPALPLGEYQVQIAYKGARGEDTEANRLFSLTTSQKFIVSDREEARIKKANVLAIVKKTVDLSRNLTPALQQELEKAYPGYNAKEKYQADQAVLTKAKEALGKASKDVDPSFNLGAMLPAAKLPAYRLEAFESEAALEQFKTGAAERNEEVLTQITGMIQRIGSGSDAKYVVDTKTEPALINKTVAYRGKDMVFAKGKLNAFDLNGKVPGYANIPFFDTLAVKGDGTLSVASSGFTFYKGEWTLDFFNGFNKMLNSEAVPTQKSGEDPSLNGSLQWATGLISNRPNPLRQASLPDVYFNKYSLFASPSFSVSGFGLRFNDFVLREGGVSFSGNISMKIADSEIKNVEFNDKGFKGIKSDVKFGLNKSLGLIKPKKGEGANAVSGLFSLVHYEQETPGITNRYNLNFDADLQGITKVHVQIDFKQVPDKRVLPNIIAFDAKLGDPGVLIAGATYLTGVRGAIRELADTIAGGSSQIPLTLEAGADISFGVKPATFYGSIDMTLKQSGITLTGKMDYRSSPSSKRVEMLKQATVSAYWITPWFVSASAEIDVLGWDVIIGKATIFIGQNLLKNRIDFEGFVSSRVQVPSKVPIVGGMSLGGISLGLNNDKMWGSYSILFLSLGITYYFNGGLEFGTSGEGLPEGLVYLQVQDPENGPRLVVFGQGVQTLATSWESTENPLHEIEYHSVADGVTMLDNGSMKLGLGGIQVADEGKLHEIPMKNVTGNALLELEYFGKNVPQFVLKDNNGKNYPLVFDETRTNPQANAFTQTIPGQNGEAKKIYIAIPKDRVGGGAWKLYADQSVESKLLNIPLAAQLDEVKLDPSGTNSSKFTASWKISNAKPGDTVNLYLTKDAVADVKPAPGQEVKMPGDAGLLIAKDLAAANQGGTTGAVTSGRTEIDVTNVALLGDKEDIRGMLAQGDYYLRAELKSSSNFQTKTTANQFKITDPLAPAAVSEVVIAPAGNGYFDLSFKPAAKKPEAAAFEHSYMIDVMQQTDGQLQPYPSFGTLLFGEEDLKPYWNAQNGKYERIPLGGWMKTAVPAPSDAKSDATSPEAAPAGERIKYTGLEPGSYYTAVVTAAVKPSKEADKHENRHYADRVTSASALLPVPSKPKLAVKPAGPAPRLAAEPAPYMDYLTNVKEQSLTLTSDQTDVEVEAVYDGRTVGQAALAAQAGGSAGTLKLTDFTADGTYAIELKAKNKRTGDYSITMLYLTVDTTPPVLYIDTPLTGERTQSGKVRVSGKTSSGIVLEANGQPVAVKPNGEFDSEVSVPGTEPTLTLQLQARDAAGNRNSATVTLTNGGYQVPVALVLKKQPTLKISGTAQLEAYLRVADGRDAAGKLRYKEVPVPQADKQRLHFTAQEGEAASVTVGGKVSAVKDGATLVKAAYRLSDSTSLEAMTVVAVEDTLTAYTSSVAGESQSTRVNVVAAGDMAKAALVYRVYKATGSSPVPAYQDDISEWTLLPAGGMIPAAAGDQIAVAKRPTGGKKATAVSRLMPAVLWKSAGGGGGAFPMPGEPSGAQGDVQVNRQKAAAVREGDRLRVTVSELPAGSGSSGLSIASQDKTAGGFELNVASKVIGQLAKEQQPVRIALPFAQLAFPATAGAGSGLASWIVKIDKNSDVDKRALEQIAGSLEAKLLGGGQGARFAVNAPQIYDKRGVLAKVALPDDIPAGDIAAVVLKDDSGQWTTVPWALEVSGNAASVKLLLTGNGSVAFIGGGKTFADVTSAHWAKPEIDEAAARLLMTGRTKDGFDPDSRITRAEYPTVLLRTLGLMNQQAEAAFADVAAGDWYSHSVALGVRYGLVDGFTDDTFRPNDSLLRVEAMAMIGRSLKLLGTAPSMSEDEVNATLEAFRDGASVPDWAREAVALCIKRGIITGQDQMIHPADTLTRAQAAAIAVRLGRDVPLPTP